MKILFLNKLLMQVFGGTEKHIKELIINLSKRGHEIIILTEKGDIKNIEELIGKKNIKVVVLPKTSVVQKDYTKAKKRAFFKIVEKSKVLWKIYIFLKKVISIKKNWKWIINSSMWIAKNKEEFEVISTHCYYEFEIAKWFRFFKKIPYVSVLEGDSFYESDAVKKSKFVMTISEFIVEQCKKIHKFKPSLIPIGIDSKKFRSYDRKKVNEIRAKFLKKGDKLALNVARYVRGKGIENMIEAAKIVIDKRKDIHFILCGDGIRKKDYEEKIKKLGIEDNFHLVPAFGNELINYYNAADFFVHVPDLSNHFGIVYLEAMAAGLPILASDYEATPSTVGSAAVLVPIENPKELSKLIIKLAEDKKLRKKLSAEGIKRVETIFNWDKLILDIEKIYFNAIKNKI